jgi:diguanylate cyclase (GGDEF)-like protein
MMESPDPQQLESRCFGMESLGYAACLCIEDGVQRIELQPDVYAGAPCINDKIDTLETESQHDALTGLQTMHALRHEYEERLDRGDKFAALFIDATNFKHINDVHSHLAGDFALQYIANVLSIELREEDAIITAHDSDEIIIQDPASKTSIVFRKGGDEFMVFLGGPDVSAEMVESVKNRISDSFDNRKWTKGYNVSSNDKPLHLRMKGIVIDPKNPLSYEEMILRVDPKPKKVVDPNDPVVVLFRSAAEQTAQELAEINARRAAASVPHRRLDDES